MNLGNPQILYKLRNPLGNLSFKIIFFFLYCLFVFHKNFIAECTQFFYKFIFSSRKYPPNYFFSSFLSQINQEIVQKGDKWLSISGNFVNSSVGKQEVAVHVADLCCLETAITL